MLSNLSNILESVLIPISVILELESPIFQSHILLWRNVIVEKTEFKESDIWSVMVSEFSQFSRISKGYAGRSSGRDAMEVF